jgi:hypothetical protein
MSAFEEWWSAQLRAERFYFADYEAARAAWIECEKRAAERMAAIAKTALGVA